MEINQSEHNLHKFQKHKFIQKNNTISNYKTCTCTKTKCLKKYCECLANNQYCYNCNCVDCHNIPSYQSTKLSDDSEVVTCTCTKSNCNKKYCECYKAGRKCNLNCRCLNCTNKFNDVKIYDYNKKDAIKENAKFAIERISVLIEDNIINIEQKEIENDIDKEDCTFLKKKREHIEDNEEESICQ